MKLALVIDDYLPDSTRVGAKMFHELAVELVSRGHDITIITPAFGGKADFSTETLDGVNIWRFKSGPIKDVNKIIRAINETLLSFKAWRAVRKHIQRDSFDGIVYYSPSIFWGGLVKKIKSKCRCPAYLVLRDFFPQWVIDAGMLRKGSLFEKYFRIFEHYAYRQADTIGVMSEKNLEIFRNHNPQYSCKVLRNWASVYPYHCCSEEQARIRTEMNLDGKIIFFYGGNIGHAQDMSNLMRLVRSMAYYKQAHFLFVGQGDEVDLINKLAAEWKLENFSYYPSVDQQKFKKLLSIADVGLFSLSADHTAHNFPGKLLGYMVHSVPILGSVNRGNDLIDIVNAHNAGLIHINGDDERLFESAKALYLDEALRKKIGQCSYNLLIEQFSVSSAAKSIELSLVGKYALNQSTENPGIIG